MTLKWLGVLAGVALAADAFMIPSTVSMPEAKGDGIEALKALDPSKLVNPQSPGQIVKLPCPKCQLPGGISADMSLILNWTVADDDKMLTLNDAPFYGSDNAEPADHYNFMQIPSALPDFLVKLLSSHGQINYQHGSDGEAHVLEPLSVNVRTNIREIEATDDTVAQLIDIDFHVDDATVGNTDGISLRVMRDEENKLNILEVVRVPADGSTPDDDKTQDPTEEEQTFEILPISPVNPASQGDAPAPPGVPVLRHKPQIVNCHGLPLSICRLRHIIKTRIMAMHRAMAAAMSGRPSRGQHRPCMKARPNGPPGLNIKGGVNKFTNPDGTPKIQHLPHEVDASPLFRACRVLRRFFFGFVVPVMIGVAAGMTASLAGMLVGTVLAMLWFKIRRGGKRGQQGNVRLEQGEEHESEGLMKEEEAEADAAPRYSEEALPAYEEKESQTEQ
ncbi:MAG: hypothetical protein Q9162_003054 [Coniocarpon cinnabarinum]